MEKKRILIVDDEEMILKVIERVIVSSLHCETVSALSGPQALKLLEQGPFDVIISDLSMPGMDGAELLDIVQELYPNTKRMVFSARAGGESALRTIGSAHQFFMKPNDVKLISEKIDRMLKLKKYLPAEGLEHVISKIRILPTQPEAFLAMEKELKERNPSIERIGQILEQDIGLSAKVIQIINSAFFGLREHVSRPAQAVALLGLNTIKSIVLGMHVFTENYDKKSPLHFSIERQWEHSINVAMTAKNIAESQGVDRKSQEQYFAAGMFHDIGKLVFVSNVPESFNSADKYIREYRVSPLDAERKIFGATHAEAGAYLMALWGFPDEVVNTCAFHHCPERTDMKGFSTVAAVHVANVFTHENVVGFSGQPEKLNMEFLAREGLAERVDYWRNLSSALISAAR